MIESRANGAVPAPARPGRRRARAVVLSALGLVLGAQGCASTTTPADDERPVRFAVIGAPQVQPASPDAAAGTPAIEDLLLEVATHLSGETGLAWCCVPGPLLGARETDRAPDRAADRDALIGALGSIAPRVLVALAPTDGPAPDLVEALGKGVSKHPGEAAYAARAEGGLRPIVVGPDGAGPAAKPGAASLAPEEGEPAEAAEAAARARSLVVTARGVTPVVDAALIVTAGDAPSLTSAGGKVVLTLPPLATPPHVWALVTVEHGLVSVEWRTALGAPAPPAPAPVSLRD